MRVLQPRNFRCLCLLLGTNLVSGMAVPVPAAAFELLGFKFFESAKADNVDEVIGDPQAYSVDFSLSGENDDIEKKLKGTSTLWKDREKPASGASGLLAKARGDYRRLLAALYSEGRYGGTISILVDGREAADLPPDAQLSDPAAIRVTIDPGPEFMFGQTSLVNRAPPPTSRHDVVKLPEDEGFMPGQLARSGVILRAERLSVEAWR